MPGKRSSSDGALLRSAVSALNQRLRREDAPSSIGPTGLGLLALLHRGGPMSATELAELAYAHPQSLTRPLQALEDSGYVGRRADKNDRRRAIISITPKGEEFVRMTMRKRVAWLSSRINAELSDDERATLREAVALMERLVGSEHAQAERARDLVFNLIPFTRVTDVDRSVKYYERLGFVVDGEFIKGGKRMFASLHAQTVHAARIMFQYSCDAIKPDQQQIFFYCWTDDVVALHARLVAEGYAPGEIETPDHMENGEFRLIDPDGYCIMVGQPRSGR